MLTKTDGKRSTYGKEVDWWSFGCLLYEMLYGKCPFRTAEAKALDEDPQKAMDKATLEYDPPYESEYFSADAKDLLQKLFNRDPERRLGHNGAREIKKHPFFASIDWGLIETFRLPPTWKPKKDINAASQDSIGAFEDVKKIKLEPEEQAQYDGWDHVSKEAVQMELVEFLQWEERKGPIKPDEEGCCIIL
jgi:serine/threonine protein kinase